MSTTDVNGRRLPGGRVTVTYVDDASKKEVTQDLLAGDSFTANLAASRLAAAASAPDFEPEETFLQSGGSGWTSSNPAWNAVETAGTLGIEAVLGSLRFAPVTQIPKGTRIDPKDNPRAVLLEPVWGGGFQYLGCWLNPETVSRLNDPFFGNADAKEWDRFDHTDVPVELGKKGSLAFLEFGPPSPPRGSRPRFLLAAWIPADPLPERPPVHVYFSPNTAKPELYPSDRYPFTGEYPYGLFPKAGVKPTTVDDLVQPYMELAYRYLLLHRILYQVIAAGRNPIVLMPVQPFGDWGPLDTRAGLGRLVKEVIRFLFARGLAATRNRPLSRFTVSPGGTTVTPKVLAPLERIPKEASVGVSGFSSGIAPVVKLCSSPAGPDPRLYSADLFQSPAADFMDVWRETWDIDGAHLQFGPWLAGVGPLKKWVDADGHRRLRAYHSYTYTFGGGDNGLVEAARIKRVPGKVEFMEKGESPDGRVTWALISNALLEGSVKDPDHKKTVPEFGTFTTDMPHHFLACLAYGHAALYAVP